MTEEKQLDLFSNYQEEIKNDEEAYLEWLQEEVNNVRDKELLQE